MTASSSQPIDLTSTAFVAQLDPAAPTVDMSSSFMLGDVIIQGKVALAPMAGVSVQAFRRQGRRFGASLVCSEMVSINGLHYENQRTQDYLRIATDEHPIAVQLFGTDPALMAEAAVKVREAGADIIDINMGCPVKKVTKTSAGCKMLDDHDLAVAVARACVEATDLPVMAKLRRGMANESLDCLTLGPRLVQEAGVSALTIHPRSAAQMYTGFADHAVTRELVKLVDVPVFASGDVTDRVRAEAVLSLTGATAVMVGRAAQGDPWLVRDIATGEAHEAPDHERVAELIRFIREVVREMAAERATGFLRKFYGWYLRGPSFKKPLRREVMSCLSPLDVERLLLDRYPEACARLEQLERTVRYPDETDRILDLPVSMYGGG